eukprot:m.16958 g.16958  ORF g.16958 m.16958 type:complete len:332 (+) comp11283_c0_seq1:231-1226(+)
MSYPMVQVWFGDSKERELQSQEMFLAVYAAGGGKRNMANFVKQPGEAKAPFRTSDVHVYLSPDSDELFKPKTKFFVCRYASSRGEWVPKPVSNWVAGKSHYKLIPEWFKAKFWDNKQEKKHPWFMFGILCEGVDGTSHFFTSSAFPVHQYYPTGVKKTDPNDPVCRMAFHKVLKQAPSTMLRPEVLLRKTGVQPVRERAIPVPKIHSSTYKHQLASPPLSDSSSSSSSCSDDSDDDRKSTDIDTRVTKKPRMEKKGHALHSTPPQWTMPFVSAKKMAAMSSLPNHQLQQQPQQTFPRPHPQQCPSPQNATEDVGQFDAVEALLALCRDPMR